MGYWKCPRCASNDAFQGTEVVSGQQPRSTAMVDTEFGVMAGQQGGGTSHKEVTVIKCKNCGEILSEKDYFLTYAEIERNDFLNKINKITQIGFWGFIIFLLLSLFLGSVLVLIVVDFDVGFHPAKSKLQLGLLFLLMFAIAIFWQIYFLKKWKKGKKMRSAMTKYHSHVQSFLK